MNPLKEHEAARMRRCPICGKPLTEAEHRKALRRLGVREKEFGRENKRLRAQLQAAHVEASNARQEGIEAQKKHDRGLMAGTRDKLSRAEDRIRQLERGTTPQTEGLEFEEKLAARLKREFLEDDIQRKGKSGDVLQIVMASGKPMGRIIYECKRTPGIPAAHVRQAQRAKEDRKANFAVLVTTGQRKGFGGFTQRDGVLVVSPLAALHAASLLRMHLIAMWQAGITKKRRQQIADRLLHYITGPEFKGPIEDATRRTSQLETDLLDEARDHKERWQGRWDHYHAIRWDVSGVRENVTLIQRGQEPKVIGRPQPAPFALPPARV